MNPGPHYRRTARVPACSLILQLNQLVDLQDAVNPDKARFTALPITTQPLPADRPSDSGANAQVCTSGQLKLENTAILGQQSAPDASHQKQKAITIHLSYELATMIDLKRKEWGLRNRGDVLEHLLDGWWRRQKRMNKEKIA